MTNFVQWMKNTLDSQASPSFGRTGAAFVIYFLVCWGCYIVSKTALIPEIPMGWISVIGLLWGATSAKEAYLRGKEIVNGNQQPTPARPIPGQPGPEDQN